MNDPTPALLELARAHGLAPRDEHGWLYFEDARTALRAGIRRGEDENAAALQLDIYLALPDGRILVESYAGIGSTDEERIRDGLDNFARTALHVFIAAFLGGTSHEDEQIERETWQVDGESFTAYMGPYATRFMSDPMIAVPGPLLPLIRETLRSQQWPGDAQRNEPHWMSTFYAHLEGAPTAVEVQLDNRRDATAASRLASLPWQAHDGYYSLRQFAVVRRDKAASEQTIANPVAYGIRCMLMQCAVAPRISDAELLWHLQRIGLDSDTATRVVVFTPLGFSNVAMTQLQAQELPTHYQPVDADKNPTGPSCALDDEPVFVQAREWARATAASEHGLAGAREVTSRCPLVHAVQQFLAENPGTAIETLRFTEPMIILGSRDA